MHIAIYKSAVVSYPCTDTSASPHHSPNPIPHLNADPNPNHNSITHMYVYLHKYM